MRLIRGVVAHLELQVVDTWSAMHTAINVICHQATYGVSLLVEPSNCSLVLL